MALVGKLASRSSSRTCPIAVHRTHGALDLLSRRVHEVPANTEALSKLIEKLEEGLPRTSMLKTSTKNIMAGKMKGRLYTDGWPEFSTAVCQIFTPTAVCQIFTPRLSEVADLVCHSTCKERLLYVLKEAELVTWGKWQRLEGVESSHADFLLENLKPPQPGQPGLECFSKGVDYGILPDRKIPDHINPNKLCPDGYFIKSLEPHHALQAASHWSTFAVRPLEVRTRYMEHLIRHFESAGVFSVDDPSRPIVWTTQHGYGQMGHMCTLPEYRRHAFGMLLGLEIGRRVLAQGDNVMLLGYVSFDNIASTKYTERMGCVPVWQRTRLVVKEASKSPTQSKL